MRILVTGGAGFIGSHLCDHLTEQGHRIWVLDDLSSGHRDNIAHLSEITTIVDSTLNQDIVADLVGEVDMVYHLAATVGVHQVVDDPITTITNNIRGTETVLEEAARQQKRILITSTSEVYGKGTNEVFQEEDDRIMGATSLSRWSYAASKAIDEFLALAFCHTRDLSCVLVRLFNTIGPRQTGRYGMVAPRFVQAALKNEPIPVYGDGQQSRCFAYVGDVVPALSALMDRRDLSGEVFNIGSNERTTIDGLARMVIDVSGSSSEIIHIPYDQAYGAGYEDMRHRAPCLKKIGAAIGYTPKTSLNDALRAIVDEQRVRTG